MGQFNIILKAALASKVENPSIFMVLQWIKKWNYRLTHYSDSIWQVLGGKSDISLRKCSFSFCCYDAENKDFTAILVTRCKITKGYNLSKTHEATVDQSHEEREWTLGIFRSFRTNLCNETVPQNSGSSPSENPPPQKSYFPWAWENIDQFFTSPSMA